LPLDENRVVQTAVPLDDTEKDYRYGSGYLIADGLVLTAAHVLERGPGVSPKIAKTAQVARIGDKRKPALSGMVRLSAPLMLRLLPIGLQGQKSSGYHHLVGCYGREANQCCSRLPAEWG
jgi:hypothetical protein